MVINLDKKTIAIIVLSVLLVVSGIFIYSKIRQNMLLVELNSTRTQELKKANEDLGKARTDVGNVKDELRNVNSDVKRYIAQYNLAVSEVGTFKGELEYWRRNASGKPITINVPGSSNSHATTTITVADMNDRIYIDDNLDGKPDRKLENLNLSYEDFHLKVNVDAIKNIWDCKLNQKFQAKMVRTYDPKTGIPQQFMEIWETDEKGKETNKMRIFDFVVTADPTPKPIAKFYKWNPVVDMGMNISMNQRLSSKVNGEVGVSLMSYGPSKDDSTWRFMRFGLNLNDGWGVSLAPVQYNFGKKIPLIEDLLVGPSITYKDGNTWYGFIISNPF